MKKRSLYISIEQREDIHVNWNEAKNRLEFLDSHGQPSKKHLISFGESYDRDKKPPKVLRLQPNPEQGIIQFGSSVCYDRYLAIDTSYKKLGDNYLCATSSLCIDQSINHSTRLKQGDELQMFSLPCLIFLAKPGINPERYGWMRVINTLVKDQSRDPSTHYGIVVDSDLSALQKINAGEEAIIFDYFIPSKFSLIYSSVDGGKEDLLNKLIGAADLMARKSLQTAFLQYSALENFVFDLPFRDIGLSNDFFDIQF